MYNKMNYNEGKTTVFRRTAWKWIWVKVRHIYWISEIGQHVNEGRERMLELLLNIDYADK